MKSHDLSLGFLFVVFAMMFAIMMASAYAKQARVATLAEKQIDKVSLSNGRTTILNFPFKPSKVILGSRGLFSVEYAENDVAIAPLVPNARSNLFVYLEGRRFAFDLATGPSGGDEVVIIRDQSERKFKVRIK